MSRVLKPDLCVIGGGSGGLTVAAGAAQMGASVVLVEGHKMGGDCLNYGCVPSKALIAAAGTPTRCGRAGRSAWRRSSRRWITPPPRTTSRA
jgi:pyruvate/2-oxoglutarate dehydrogenase complex dihydrolipoamide dehydrogenase (E3) component